MTIALLIGHGVLAALAIVISILGVQTRVPERARKLATWLLVVVGLQTALGDVLYPIYVVHAKPVLATLHAGARSVADLFDVKEHLAFFALVFTLSVFVLSRSQRRTGPLLRVLFGCAHGSIVLVAVLGLAVASVKLP
jgi:hypothetical protein